MPRRLHRWAGLVLGIPLALLALSGATLVYREKIERTAKPVPLTVDPRGRSPLPLDEIAARILEQNPGHRLTYLQTPTRRDGPVEIVLASGGRTRFLAADPFTGETLGLLSGGAPNPFESIRRIHANWLLGPPGRHFNGFLAAALAALALSGLFLSIRAPRPWHARAGLIFALPLLLAALSGVLLIWGRVPASQPSSTGTAPTLPLETYAQAANRALPNTTLSWISLGDPVTVRLRLPSDWQRRGSNDVHLHPATGEVLRLDLFRNAPLSRRLYAALTAIHYAEWGGALGRFLWALTGVSAAVLWVTSLALLFRRQSGPAE